MLKRIKQFIAETVTEMKKVSWPSREELIGSTVVVFAVVAILSLYIGVLDVAISKILEIIVTRK
ncbi:MAG: preprotein translocase subunit SecE [Candidatus Firestonebacteria bacterium]